MASPAPSSIEWLGNAATNTSPPQPAERSRADAPAPNAPLPSVTASNTPSRPSENESGVGVTSAAAARVEAGEPVSADELSARLDAAVGRSPACAASAAATASASELVADAPSTLGSS